MSTDKKIVSPKPGRQSPAQKAKKSSVLGESMVKIRLKAYYPDRLDHSVKKIIEAVEYTGAVVKGPMLLPTRRHKWTLLTSPHVDKDAREQLQLTRHARLLVVHVSSADTMNAIQQVELPPEVAVMIQVVDG